MRKIPSKAKGRQKHATPAKRKHASHVPAWLRPAKSGNVPARDLYRLRQALGLSLETAGRLLGVAFSSYHRWETGEVGVPAWKFEGIKKRLTDWAAAQKKGKPGPRLRVV